VTAGRARRENHVLAAVYQLRGRGYIANINDKVPHLIEDVQKVLFAFCLHK